MPPTLAAVGRDRAAASTGPAGERAMSLNRALVPIPPPSGEGEGALVDGYSARLDEARVQATELSSRIDALATRYAAETGVKALRIRVNQAIGWHVEVPAAHAASLGPAFLLRQGLASSTRYSTAELDSLATALEEARERVGLAERAAIEGLQKRRWQGHVCGATILRAETSRTNEITNFVKPQRRTSVNAMLCASPLAFPGSGLLRPDSVAPGHLPALRAIR